MPLLTPRFSSRVRRLRRKSGSYLLTLLGIGRDFYRNLIRRFALDDALLRFLYADRKLPRTRGMSANILA